MSHELACRIRISVRLILTCQNAPIAIPLIGLGMLLDAELITDMQKISILRISTHFSCDS